MTTSLEPGLRRDVERDLIARYLGGLRAGGVQGLQTQENADAAFGRACTAVEDLDTAALMDRLYR